MQPQRVVVPFVSSLDDVPQPSMPLSFQYHSAARISPAPSVLLSLAHDDTNLYASFRVIEPTVRAVSSKDQDPVYEDSCVEIFITHEGIEGKYCNFEFSCTGICLAYVGPSRSDRMPLPQPVLASIRRYPSLGTEPFPECPTNQRPWSILVTIPAAAFFAATPLSTLQNVRFNAYKCGDEVFCHHFTLTDCAANTTTLAVVVPN